MAWTNVQKQIAARACQAAGIDDEQRRFLLRQFPRAKFDREGKPCPEPTSTSQRLNNSDFEQFMSMVERQAGGCVLHFSKDYWSKKAAGDLSRMRHLVESIDVELAAQAPKVWRHDSLAGWIRARITRGETDQLAALNYDQLEACILSLRSFARQHGVVLDAPRRRGWEPAARERTAPQEAMALEPAPF